MTPPGADELMFLDITASHEGRGAILDVIARTADVCFMPVSVGGGIRTVEDARAPAARRGRQDLDQHRRGGGPRPDHPLRRRLRLPGGGRGDRRQAGRRRLGASSPTAAAATPAWTPSTMRPLAVDKRRRRDPAHLHGPRRRQDRLRPRPARRRSSRRRRAGDRHRRRGQTRSHLVDAVQDGGADAVLAASIFHFGEITIGEAKARHGRRRPPGPAIDGSAWAHEPLHRGPRAPGRRDRKPPGRRSGGLLVGQAARRSGAGRQEARRGGHRDGARRRPGRQGRDRRRERRPDLPLAGPAGRHRGRPGRGRSRPRSARRPLGRGGEGGAR